MEVTANGAPKSNGRSEPETVTRLLWELYWEDPCDAHRNLLVETYQKLVRDVVRRFAARLPRTIDRGDLLTAGNVGLISAIQSFDPERGVRFESYCEMRIKGALLDELLRRVRIVPEPLRAGLRVQVVEVPLQPVEVKDTSPAHPRAVRGRRAVHAPR